MMTQPKRLIRGSDWPRAAFASVGRVFSSVTGSRRSCARPPAHLLRKPSPDFLSSQLFLGSRHHHQTTVLQRHALIAALRDKRSRSPSLYSLKPFLVDFGQRTSLCPSKTSRPSVSVTLYPSLDRAIHHGERGLSVSDSSIASCLHESKRGRWQLVNLFFDETAGCSILSCCATLCG